jgi:sugar phosphate isomerase/epimerase
LLSLAHLTFVHADPVELVRLGAAGGFDGVGLRLIDPAPEAPHFPVVTDAALRRRTKAELVATGLRVFDVEAVWLWPRTEVARVRPVLEAGADLGAEYVLVAGNDPDRARMTDSFAAVCTLARETGLKVGFEFIPYTALNSLPVAYEVLKDAAQPNSGLLIDILHLSRSGGRPADIAAIDPGHIAYGHLCDAPALPPPPEGLRHEARAARLYPGEGSLPLIEFLQALPAGAPIALEAPTTTAADDFSRAREAGEACRRVLAEAAMPASPAR